MAKTKAKSPEKRVQELETQIAELEGKRAAAMKQTREIDQRLADIQRAEAEIATQAYLGDEDATAELERLREEQAELQRSTQIARLAIPQLGERLAGLQVRANAAQRDVSRAEYEEISAEREELGEEAEKTAEHLRQLLSRMRALDISAVRALQAADPESTSDYEMVNRSRALASKVRGWFDKFMTNL
jgi:chromosome segregation ATPase